MTLSHPQDMLKAGFIPWIQWIVGSSPTMTVFRSSVKEGSQTCKAIQSKPHLIHPKQPVFIGTTKERKVDTQHDQWVGSSWINGGLPKGKSLYGVNVKALSEANQSRTHLRHRAQPVFRQSLKEGKGVTSDV